MPFSRSLTALLAAGWLAVAAPSARAEDEAGPADPRAKLKAQVEKILKLMRENETALLEASMAGGAAPKGPEVKVPDVPPAPGTPGKSPETPPSGTPPPSGSGAGGAEGAPAGGDAGTRGSEIRKRLDEIIKGQQSGSSRIPEELAELVRMIPPSGGGSGSQQGPEEQPQDGDKNESPEARDARKRKELEEQQKKEQGGKDPKNPQDQRDPQENGGRPPGESEPPPQNPRDPKERPWLTELPPEHRDSDAGGGLESLPGRLGQIIQDYLRSLHTQGSKGTTTR